ncbi:MAG: hypothetical protein CVU02_03015 [Bacteroidetes bacterium HGW-Bacteroidetes-19]|nr:MAG: hypothetical protein CVU04_03545 [Bacteroidetes bacterium HGW-Bacteroidetes-20]PKP27632.1 MAG: hypothetical protein CVU02_03015 [Bacteroidetes bacterium HGW-Bacteroidetes-19]
MIHLKKIIIVAVCSICTLNLCAQYKLSSHLDLGKSNISNGLYISNSTFFDYQYKNSTGKVGIHFNLLDQSFFPSFFTGFHASFTQKIKIKKLYFTLQALYFSHFFSNLIHEHNYAIVEGLELNHFSHKLGLHFRNLRFTQEGVDQFGIVESRSIYELFNLVYFLKYNFKPKDHPWNIGIILTNMDHFVINQASNPMLVLDGNVKIKEKVSLYFETWFQRAGVMNISANHYGFFMRTGVLWDIK